MKDGRNLGDWKTSYLRHNRTFVPDDDGDPMESVANHFDVAMLIGIGFLVVALNSFGLKELISSSDVTIVKNPGTSSMEIITKTDGKIERLESSDASATGRGAAIGTVYKLEDGQVIWVPDGE